MKTIYLIVIFLLFSLQPIHAQTELDNLWIAKQGVLKKIKELQDSLVKINQEILKKEKNSTESELNKIEGSQIFVEISKPYAKLYSDSDVSSSIIDSISKGTKVQILDVGGLFESYLKTEYNEKIGYLLINEIIQNKEFQTFRNGIKTKNEEQSNKIQADKRRSDLVKKYGINIGLKIDRGEIWIGMDKNMVIESLGRPKNINRTVSSNSVLEQWVYESRYLYLNNDKLKSWQDSY